MVLGKITKDGWGLGHVVDVTQYIIDMSDANKIVGLKNKEGKNIYENGYFICHDVLDTHIYRIQVGINSEYDYEPRTKIIETNDISHEKLAEYCAEKFELGYLSDIDVREVTDFLIHGIGVEKLLKAIVEIDYDDGFENCDVDEYRYDTPLSELINNIDGGYGITKIELALD